MYLGGLFLLLITAILLGITGSICLGAGTAALVVGLIAGVVALLASSFIDSSAHASYIAARARQHRAAEIAAWETAYRDTHHGQAPPVGYALPIAQQPRTNVFAILALVFGLLGGLLGIVFGHIALSQIKRTGESGRGMALAGLILSYFWLAVLVIYFIWLATLVSSISCRIHAPVLHRPHSSEGTSTVTVPIELRDAG